MPPKTAPPEADAPAPESPPKPPARADLVPVVRALHERLDETRHRYGHELSSAQTPREMAAATFRKRTAESLVREVEKLDGALTVRTFIPASRIARGVEVIESYLEALPDIESKADWPTELRTARREVFSDFNRLRPGER